MYVCEIKFGISLKNNLFYYKKRIKIALIGRCGNTNFQVQLTFSDWKNQPIKIRDILILAHILYSKYYERLMTECLDYFRNEYVKVLTITLLRMINKNSRLISNILLYTTCFAFFDKPISNWSTCVHNY